jgi:hypothetical protein
MGAATYLQPNFLGGEWSKYAQGRADEPGYRTAMNLSSNGFPLEEGGWTRRPGTRYICPTRRGQAGRLLPFHFTQTAPYTMVFTNSHLRFTNGSRVVLDGLGQTVASISTDSPAEVSTQGAHGWATGDDVMFFLADGDHFNDAALLYNRQFTITVTGAESFTLADALTQAPFDGLTVDLNGTPVQVARVMDFVTPYASAKWESVKPVQSEQFVLLLHPEFQPRVLTAVTADDGSVSNFTLETAEFKDGPYMDPPKDGSTITPSAVSNDSMTGHITLEASNAIFATTDVGRHVRLLSEPPIWDAGTAYAEGDVVAFNDTYWQALAASTGTQPDLDVSAWVANPEAGAWTWLKIDGYTDPTHVTAIIEGNDLLYALPVRTYRLGLYSDTTGWPGNGCWHEGRVWLSGAVKNRFDASSNADPLGDPFNFEPTGPDGTVADDNGISATIDATDINSIFWMLPSEAGIVLGTPGGEWLIQASQLSDPLTPTSVQAHRRTKFGCSDVLPVDTPLAILFIQRYNRKIVEYLADAYSGKYSGSNLTAKARHLMANGVEELAYIAESTPMVWARLPNGSLAASTYKRESPFSSQAPTMNGWHRHHLANGRKVTSIAAGPSMDGGATDTLTLISWDSSAGFSGGHQVELLTPVYAEGDDLDDAWFLDSAVQPTGAQITEVGPDTFIVLYGLGPLEGEEVTLWGAGFDLGEFTVTDGKITVPIDAAGSLFTQAWLDELTEGGKPYEGLGVVVNTLGQELVPNPNGASIGQLVPSTLDQDTSYFIADWVGGQGFTNASGNSLTTDGWTRYDLATQAVTGEMTVEDATGGEGGFAGWPAVIHPGDGMFYTFTGSVGGGPYRKIDPDTMLLQDTFGVVSPGSFNTSSSGGAPPTSIAPLIGLDGKNYLLTGRMFFNSYNSEIAVIDVDEMEWTGYSEFPGEAVYVVAPGARGEAWAMGHWQRDFDQVEAHAHMPAALRKVTVDADGTVASTLVGSIVPHDIAADWTHISGITGLGYDQTDGNLLFFCKIAAESTLDWSNAVTYINGATVLGSDNHVYIQTYVGDNLNHDPTTDMGVHWEDQGVATYAHSQYLVKLSREDGSVLWATDLGWYLQQDAMLSQSRIRYGILGFLSPQSNGSTGGIVHYPYQLVNTLDGTVQEIDMFQCSTWSSQTFDSQTGTLVADVVYVYASGHIPAPVEGSPTTYDPGWAVFPVVTTPGYYAPFVVGYTYTSQGQILRAIAPQEAGAQNGPALAKTRRLHQFGVLLHGTRGVSFGTDFNTLIRPVEFKSPGGTPYNAKQQFSGVHWNTLEDNYDYDGMVCWQTTRPYPTTVLSVQAFLHTQDR